MFWTHTESHGISSTFDLLLSGRFLFHLSIASGRLRCPVTGVPPQPNSPTDQCLEARLDGQSPGSTSQFPADAWHSKRFVATVGPGHGPTDVQWLPVPGHSMSKAAVKVVVFHCWSCTTVFLFLCATQSYPPPEAGPPGSGIIPLEDWVWPPSSHPQTQSPQPTAYCCCFC